MGVGFVSVVAMALVGFVFLLQHREPTHRARFLRRAGFTLMALFATFFGLFVAATRSPIRVDGRRSGSSRRGRFRSWRSR